MESLIDFSHFSARGYLPLIRKDSVTHVHGLADYLKERYTFALDLPLRLDCVKSVHIFPHLDKIRIISPYSVRMREKTDQKNFEYGHFFYAVLTRGLLHSVFYFFSLLITVLFFLQALQTYSETSVICVK